MHTGTESFYTLFDLPHKFAESEVFYGTISYVFHDFPSRYIMSNTAHFNIEADILKGIASAVASLWKSDKEVI